MYRESIVHRSYVKADALVSKTKAERKQAKIRAQKESLIQDRSSNRRYIDGLTDSSLCIL